MAITRSVGISPGVAWCGPLPGGGYNGKTKRLDKAVMRFAVWLQNHIGGPVEIRFNADQLSGGAYVSPGVTDAKDAFHTPTIGLGASLITPAHVRRQRDKIKDWRNVTPFELLDCWTEATPLKYDVAIDKRYLRDPSNLGENEPDSGFGYWRVKTPREATRLLQKLVNPARLR